MTLSPAALSHDLRKGTTPHLQRRRWLVGLSFVGTTAGMIVSLYQMGMVRRLPDLPHPLFDATEVDASPYAYKRAATPDALLMVASYAVTAILAGMGPQNRARTMPAVPLAMAGKAAYDLFIALKLGREEWQERRKLCGYCQSATLASALSLALAMPEALSAWRGLRRG